MKRALENEFYVPAQWVRQVVSQHVARQPVLGLLAGRLLLLPDLNVDVRHPKKMRKRLGHQGRRATP